MVLFCQVKIMCVANRFCEMVLFEFFCSQGAIRFSQAGRGLAQGRCHRLYNSHPLPPPFGPIPHLSLCLCPPSAGSVDGGDWMRGCGKNASRVSAGRRQSRLEPAQGHFDRSIALYGRLRLCQSLHTDHPQTKQRQRQTEETKWNPPNRNQPSARPKSDLKRA